jgi:hypothetical protein
MRDLRRLNDPQESHVENMTHVGSQTELQSTQLPLQRVHSSGTINRSSPFSPISPAVRSPNGLAFELIDNVQFLNTLTDFYLAYCHNQQYCLFHPPTLRKAIIEGTLPRPLLFAFCAVAGRHTPHDESRPRMVDLCAEYTRHARSLIFDAFDTICLETIQTLALLSVYEQNAGNGAKGWTYTGIALRMVQTLGFDCESEEEDDLEEWVREVRRRCFWTLFMQVKLTY